MNGAKEISVSQQGVVTALPNWTWALKRAALGTAILLIVVTTAACLLYAGIEQDRPAASQQLAHSPASGIVITGSNR